MTDNIFDPKTVWAEEFQDSLVDIIDEAMKMAVDMQSMIGQESFIDVKHDNTLVTKADKAVEAHIKDSLAKLSKNVFFLGEETAQAIIKERKSLPNIFWICDPIDGTSGYALGKPDFAITLSLVVNRRPLFGLIALPHYHEICYTKSYNEVVLMARKDKSIKALSQSGHHQNKDRLIIGPGRLSAVQIYKSIFGYEPKSVQQRASALKFVELLKDNADVYIREKQLCEWDVAAGDALLHALGGSMISYDTREVLYYGSINEEFKVKAILAQTH